MARARKNPRVLIAAFVASTLVVVSYKIYQGLKTPETKKGKAYTNKSIALTLLHSVLQSDLPLNEILLNLENVTFILPPYLSVDDLACNIRGSDDIYNLPQTLIKNYKLLKCSNIQGYFHVVKNLKPDMLFVCSEDLGLSPPDLGRFVKEVVPLALNKDDVYSVLSKVLLK